MKFCEAGAVLLLLGAAAPTIAQEPPPATTVAPGSPLLNGERLRPGTTTYAWVVTRAGQSTPLAEFTDALSAEDVDGEPAWRRVVTVRRNGGGGLVDSTWTRQRTLAPLRHRSHQPQRLVSYDFAPEGVNGQITAADGSVSALAHSSAVPLFDSGNWDLVLRSLPLEPGRSFDLPVYDSDRGGEVHYRAHVRGTDPLPDGAGRTAWRVDAELGQQNARLWLDPGSRELLHAEIEVAPGAVLRYLRQ